MRRELYRVKLDGRGEERGGVVVEAALMSSHILTSDARPSHWLPPAYLPALLHDSCSASHSHGRTACCRA